MLQIFSKSRKLVTFCELFKLQLYELVHGYVSEMAKNLNLHILNTNPLCTGVTTRHRKTVSGEEKSVIDFILV